MGLYSRLVMDHFMSPKNMGALQDADAVGKSGNEKCGDSMKIYLKIRNEIIVNAGYQVDCCGSAIAASSVITERIKGRPASEAAALARQAVEELQSGLPAYKQHCPEMVEQALQNALSQYQESRDAASEEGQKI